MKRALLIALGLVLPSMPAQARHHHPSPQEEVEDIYAEWLQHYADRQPELAIAMTSSDFVMVNTTTRMNRSEALAFVQAIAQFILSRECTHSTIAWQPVGHQTSVLDSRVDCTFQTVQGPLEAHFLETIVVDKHGTILYDRFSDIANPSLP